MRSGSTIPVVILNWNGTDDTLECLRSMLGSDASGFFPVIVDNGSRAEEYTRLEAGCRALFPNVVSLTPQGLQAATPAAWTGRPDVSEGVVLIATGDNLGFAIASNIGARVAELCGGEWVMLLNNDTVVAPDAFRILRAFLDGGSPAVALTPQIRHFDRRDVIQNCGGQLTYFGSRRYLFADQAASVLAASVPFSVTFATGCALLYKFRVTGLLTEDFYFGEEDYEFALRLQQHGHQMVCLPGAVVYHKGGASIKKRTSPWGAVLVSYVNRLINTRHYYSAARWQATRLFAYLRLPLLLWRNGIDPRRALPLIRRAEAFLRTHNDVRRTEHDAMVASNS